MSRPRAASTRRYLGRIGAAVLALGFTAVQAQALRDPTAAPAAAGSTQPDAGRQDESPKTGSMALLTRDGVPHLMHGTRLYAVGQNIGQARIERITETEVWLREAGQLQKIAIFNGVQRRATAAPVVPTRPSVAPVILRRTSPLP